MEECRQSCTDVAPPAYPEYRGPEEAIDRIFGEMPVEWVRVRDFQVESLKLVTERVLEHSSYYKQNPGELTPGLKVPGELGAFAFSSPVTLLFCSENSGAREVAEDVRAEAVKRQPNGSADMVVVAEMAPGAAAPTGKATLLIYLNHATFSDPGGATAAAVKRALDLKMPVVMLHEQNEDKGGCPFFIFFNHTPRDLQIAPYRLFDALAVPLYPSAELRAISLRYALRGMGAKPIQAGLGRAAVKRFSRLSTASLSRKSKADKSWVGPERSAAVRSKSLSGTGEADMSETAFV